MIQDIGKLEQTIRKKAWDNHLCQVRNWCATGVSLCGHDNAFRVYHQMVEDKSTQLRIENQAVLDFISSVEELQDRVSDIEAITQY